MTGGARAAVYKGAAVLFGAEDWSDRFLPVELGLPCVGETPYYLAQRRAGGRKEEEEGGTKIEI